MAILLREPEAEPRYPFEAYPLSQFLELPCKPISWIVPGLVPAGGLTITVSAPNTGKTLLAFDHAAYAASNGIRSLVIEEEGGLRGSQERMRRAAEANGLVGESGDVIRMTWNTGISLLDATHVNYLCEYITECGIEYLVLDSLSALARGVDENDSKDMSLLSETLHVIKKSTGCAVHAQHHMVKESWKPGAIPSLASARGHGALAARADAMIALVPLEQRAGVVRLELHNIKQRDAERATPRTVEVAMTGTAATVTYSGIGENAVPAVVIAADLLARVLRAIPEDGEGRTVSRGDIARKITARNEDVTEAVHILKSRSQVFEPMRGALVKRQQQKLGA